MQYLEQKSHSSVCPICSSSDIHFLFNTYDRLYGCINMNFDIFRCYKCESLFLNPMISSEEILNLYPKDTYYAYKEVDYNALQFNNISGLKQYLKRLRDLLFFHEPFKNNLIGKKILDFGCGNGLKLYEYKQKGMDVYGVEIDKGAAKLGNINGINIFNGTVFEAGYRNEYFDFIRCRHSLEHLVNPLETVKEFYRICKKGGTLFIEVPNIKSIPFYLFKKYWLYLTIPFHPFNHSPKSIKLILQNNGFKVERVIYNGSYVGILYSIQLFLNSIKRNKKAFSPKKNSIFAGICDIFALFFNWIKLGDTIEIIAKKK